MNIKLKSFPGLGLLALKLLLAGCLAATAQGAGVFTSTSPSYWQHEAHTATLLTNGLLLVAGGGVSSAELYNPATGIWTVTGSLGAARASHTATRGEVSVRKPLESKVLCFSGGPSL